MDTLLRAAVSKDEGGPARARLWFETRALRAPHHEADIKPACRYLPENPAQHLQ
jgi:hypothetical protein